MPKRRHAVASLGQLLRREFRESVKLLPTEIDAGDETLLRTCTWRCELLCELEKIRRAVLSLMPQT
jgi:hypothetical protein